MLCTTGRCTAPLGIIRTNSQKIIIIFSTNSQQIHLDKLNSMDSQQALNSPTHSAQQTQLNKRNSINSNKLSTNSQHTFNKLSINSDQTQLNKLTSTNLTQQIIIKLNSIYSQQTVNKLSANSQHTLPKLSTNSQ